MRESKRYEEMNMIRAYQVWTVGETAAPPSVQSPLLFYGITKVVSNGCGPVSLYRGYPCDYKSAGKAHCGKPRSPPSCIASFSYFARVFTASLALVMDLGKCSHEESSEVDGLPSLPLILFARPRVRGFVSLLGFDCV